MTHSKSLSSSANGRIRDLLRTQLQERFEGNLTAMAAHLRVSQSMLWEILHERRGAGNKVLASLPRLGAAGSKAAAEALGIAQLSPEEDERTRDAATILVHDGIRPDAAEAAAKMATIALGPEASPAQVAELAKPLIALARGLAGEDAPRLRRTNRRCTHKPRG